MIKRLRHWAHYKWNYSRWNPDFDPWISSCICCCIKCEDKD